jgi:hypothetical protein
MATGYKTKPERRAAQVREFLFGGAAMFASSKRGHCVVLAAVTPSRGPLACSLQALSHYDMLYECCNWREVASLVAESEDK